MDKLKNFHLWGKEYQKKKSYNSKNHQICPRWKLKKQAGGNPFLLKDSK
jgi:hypothetical protein